jgi:hypothetical protein
MKKKNMNRSVVILVLVIIGFLSMQETNAQLKIELIDDTQLTTEGLYFEGTKGVDYQFGKQITPHGDCIDVINGYVFVTWYKGGMDKRNLMVSRKKVDGGEWQTIEFTDRHIGYRGDPTIGDSHNTAAIVICPIDNTVHLIYDMHAYSKASYPNHYFNYRVSIKDAAFVPDEEWNISLFNQKRHYLNENINYEKSTYPGFLRFDDGRIMVDLRFGGSGNGNNVLAVYDGFSWSENIQYNNGNQPGDEKYSIYGSYQYLHGKLIAGYSIRYSIANTGSHPLYQLNNGLFYSEAETPYSKNDWTDLTGNSIVLPVQNPNHLKVAEPCAIGIGTRIAMGPIWTVTKNGAAHFLTAVSGNDVHFYKAPGSNTFSYSENCPKANGVFFNMGDKVLNVALESNRVVIRLTSEGENNWQSIYKQTSGDKYRHFKAVLRENKLFVYAMKVGSGKAQPVTLLTYLLTDETTGIKRNTVDTGTLKIYPNPVNGFARVSGMKTIDQISVFNLNGQKVKQFIVDSENGSQPFDFSGLDDGMYFLKTKNDAIKFISVFKGEKLLKNYGWSL